MRAKLLIVVSVVLLLTQPARAIELTGVLLLPVTLEGGPVGPVWHTSSGDDGRPLGVSMAAPTAVRAMPMVNADNGEIDIGLTPGPNLVTALWQYLANELPPAMVLNLYFNGDNLTPGISAIVGTAPGFTQFIVNAAPSTLSLYLRDVENRPGLSFDDGTFNTTLSAALYFPSNGLTLQLRPQALTDLDRVGVDSLNADGRPDGVMLFELSVGPTTLRPRAPLPRPLPRAAAPVVMPVPPRVGEDLWVPPAAPAEAIVSPTAAPTGVPRDTATAAADPTAAATAAASSPVGSVSTANSTPARRTPTAVRSATPLTTRPPATLSTVAPTLSSGDHDAQATPSRSAFEE